MTPDHDDPRLRQAFTELRREDATAAPAFDTVLARQAPRERSLRPLLAASLAAAVVVAALALGLLVRQPQPSPSPLPLTLAWTAPTDFLLRTPGIEVLETVPRIGTPPLPRRPSP